MSPAGTAAAEFGTQTRLWKCIMTHLNTYMGRCPHRLYEIVLQAIVALRNHCSMNTKKRYWWTGATITQIQPPLFIPANSMLKYSRTFDGPLKSYKWKEDLEALAGALGLSRDRKIADLSVQIAAHLQDLGTYQSLAVHFVYNPLAPHLGGGACLAFDHSLPPVGRSFVPNIWQQPPVSATHFPVLASGDSNMSRVLLIHNASEDIAHLQQFP
ncbi:hypothetical protein BD769DRAFT_1384263 [Suillus cothurnatus]|nr:hypothetical protein BD769DRAFT_1384263 [Suillus cothurnatus]